MLPRFNFRKAKWEKFTEELDQKITNIEAVPKNYDIQETGMDSGYRKHSKEMQEIVCPMPKL